MNKNRVPGVFPASPSLARWSMQEQSCAKRIVTSFISKRTLEKARGLELVRIKREQANQALCFSSRPFVLCGLPVRRLPQGQLMYQWRNGQFALQITGHPDFGVPFGQDRIVPIFLATLAVQQKSPVIRFRSAGEMLETFGMHKGGKEYRRLVNAFERIFGATIFFGTDQIRATAKLVQRTRFNFLREAQIWYNRQADQPVLCEDSRTLSCSATNSTGRSRIIRFQPIWMSSAFCRRRQRFSTYSCGAPIGVSLLALRRESRSLVV